MGIDLKLLPLETREDMDWGFAHTMLELDRRHELWDFIDDEVPVITKDNFKFSSYCAPIPSGEWEGENGYGEITEDPYGNAIKWCRAGKLAEVMEKFYTDGGGYKTDYRNLAAIAYLKVLPTDNLIALYWH